MLSWNKWYSPFGVNSTPMVPVSVAVEAMVVGFSWIPTKNI
jgi:hypothetical protein